jgi:hypothetical protein
LAPLESAKLDALQRHRVNHVPGELDHRGRHVHLDVRRRRDLVAPLYLVALQALRDEACRRVRFFLP